MNDTQKLTAFKDYLVERITHHQEITGTYPKQADDITDLSWDTLIKMKGDIAANRECHTICEKFLEIIE